MSVKSGHVPRKNSRGARLCGAKTKTCQCKHHISGHAGRVGRCGFCVEPVCEVFVAGACDQPSMKGRERCRIHGGKADRGMLSPSWKDGRWGKSLPLGVRDRFYEALVDPSLMQLRQDAALIDGMLTNALGRLKDNRRPSEKEERRILTLSAELRKIKESEGRRLRDLRMMVPRDQFLAFGMLCMQLFREFVTDADGKPDIPRLRVVQTRIQASLQAAVQSTVRDETDVVDGEIEEG